MELKHSEILRNAKELISDEGNWTQHEFARSYDGRPVSPEDREATCWCGFGAIRKFLGQSAASLRMYRMLDQQVKSCHFPSFNDAPNTTHAMVMDVFDKAIALAKAEEAAESEELK